MEKARKLTLLLPDEMLAAVLACLPPRGLAASRCVCKAWRAVVDDHRLLRKEDFMPLSVGGIFPGLWGWGFPPLFSQPSPTRRPTIGGDLSYLEGARNVSAWLIEDHCDGLLLFSECPNSLYPAVCSDHVVNPATRQWASLPPRPPSSLPLGMKGFSHSSHIIFDPVTSPHFEVLLVPKATHFDLEVDSATKELEWPPSPCAMRIFSSRTGHWDERLFIREGPALGTVGDMKVFPFNPDDCYGVYWRGSLYVQCHQDNFVMRINLSTGSYHLIAPPAPGYNGFHLGKSEEGVYYGTIYGCELLVWFLDESCGQAQWMLKCDRYISPTQACRKYDEHINGPWSLQTYGNEEDYMEEILDDEDSDDDALVAEYMAGLDEEALDQEIPPYGYLHFRYDESLTFLGFHPYKEIVFLDFLNSRGIAYHLNTSKMQDLGSLVLSHPRLTCSFASFVYTPCLMGEFPENN
ncbi:unnamed protein product [Urochloa humidicola]